MSGALDAGIAALLLGVAFRVLLARDPFGAVIGFVALGLVLALAWVRLAAVDVALTEAAIGGGVTGLVMVRAAARLPKREGARQTADRGTNGIAAGLCVLVFIGLSAVVLGLPEPAPTLAPEAAAHLPGTGLGNPVTAVLLVYRALDTLLEVVVLLLALIAIWSLSADASWRGAPPPPGARQPTEALVFLARVLPPVGVLVAIYLFWAGADVPGGAFQGGAVLAAMGLLVLLAGLRAPPRIGDRGLRLLVLAGPVVFLAVGMLGWAVAGAFLGYPEGAAKPVIIAVEAALTLSIAVMLALLVLGPPVGARQP